MIKFDDGTEISWEEAARMIIAEGRLGTGVFVDATGLRCPSAVIRNVVGPRGGNLNILKFAVDAEDAVYRIFLVNDAFVGTPEERAVYMAQWCRAQEGA